MAANPRLADRLAAHPPYAWRSVAGFPSFPDDRPLIVFDGVCVLCSGFARFVARHDRDRHFRFTAAQSELGQALYRHYDLDPVNYETNLLIADGRASGKMEAFAGIMERLGGVWRLARAVLCVPAPLRDRLYDAIARNRYRLFGRRAICIRPDATWRERVID